MGAANGERGPVSAAPRVVLDTNLVVSALLFPGGRPAELRRGWHQGRFVPLVSRETAGEIIRVLAYPKFRLGPEDRRVLLADYLPYTETVRIPDPPPDVPPCRDPFDVPFLLLAIVGSAEFLVTGDRDLLLLDGQVPCPIVTAEGFLRALGRRKGGG